MARASLDVRQDEAHPVGMPVRMTDLVTTGVFPHRIAAQLIGTFGAVGLLLALLGTHGVLSFQGSRRTREIGIRRALGATVSNMVWRVVRGGLALALLGCGIGAVVGARESRGSRATSCSGSSRSTR